MVVGTAGRPRSFDQEKALEEALKVFWEQGFEGTSLSDLTKAMGINKPSMYSAFGNKEQLFLKAVEMYKARESEYFYQALEQSDIRKVITDIIIGCAEAHSCKDKPKGCLMIQGALACSTDASPIKQAMMDCRKEMGDILLTRFTKAQNEGQLIESADPQVMTHFMATFLNGLSVHSMDDVSPEMIIAVAELGIKDLHAFCLN